MTAFTLAPQIAAESTPIAELGLSLLLAKTTAPYPWLILVPRRAATEITDLAAEDRGRLIEEVATASRALKSVTGCEKLNIAALGNIVRQLHVHLIARSPADPGWPEPVWAAASAPPLTRDEIGQLVAGVRAEIAV
jgi:diadenosine tetraphosphate (Ap4A) HIT family hydrolase